MDDPRERINSWKAPLLDREESRADLPEGVCLAEVSGSEQGDWKEDEPSQQPRPPACLGGGTVAHLRASLEERASSLNHGGHGTHVRPTWSDLALAEYLGVDIAGPYKADAYRY